MKKLILFLTFSFTILNFIQAQIPPNAFNYSAVARDVSGQLIVNSNLGIQISILKTTSTGSVQYSENHSVTTDEFGLFNLVIGGGAVQSGSIGSIDWSNDNYYLKVGMDVTGGTNFLTMGTTQLLSVPYALYAKSAGSVNGGGTGGGPGGSFTHYIGEQFGGGVIFHLWKDTQGVEHGLIVDKTDLSPGQPWSNITSTLIGLSAQSSWDGSGNSNAIIGQSGHTSSAAALCLSSTNEGQSDWYLPSIQELNMLWNNYYTVSRSLSQISGASLLQPASYWSSTEFDGPSAWSVFFGGSFGGVATSNTGKNSFSNTNGLIRIRSVRAF